MIHLNKIYWILLVTLLTGCNPLSGKDMVIMDIHIGSVLVQEEDVIFKKNGKTYVAKGEASKFANLKTTKQAEFQRYYEANEQDRKNIRTSWFVRFADYGGKITLLE